MQDVERVARVLYDAMEGPVNNQDFARQQRQWILALDLAIAAMAETRRIDAEALRAFADHIPLAGGCFLALDDMTVAAMAGWLKGRADEQ